MERNWRLGAEEEPAPKGKPPKELYEEIFALFRADHHEAMRLRSEFPARAKTLMGRASGRLAEMQERLPDSQRKPFEEMRARYDKLIAEALELSPAICNAKAQSFESDIAKRFAAEKIIFENGVGKETGDRREETEEKQKTESTERR